MHFNVTRLAIVAYPEVGIEAGRWLEDVRAAHDPQRDLIAAHFTLVFPCVADPSAVASEIEAVASSREPIRIRFTGIKAVPDALGAGAHVFLLPDQDAEAALIALHDSLYAGVLRPHLRADLSFVPHVTIASAPDIRRCEDIATSLQERAIAMRGTISELVLVDVTTRPVTPLVRRHLVKHRSSTVTLLK